MSGIKEVSEVIAAAKSYCVAVTKSCADGKLNFFDARHLLAPVKATLEAVRGAESILTELKDVDAAELDSLINDFGALAQDAMAAAAALQTIKA